jgi:hypothetical protein
VASEEFRLKYGFHSGDWGEQRQQIVAELRGMYADPSLPQERKIEFGKALMGRMRAAYAEAHKQDIGASSVCEV